MELGGEEIIQKARRFLSWWIFSHRPMYEKILRSLVCSFPPLKIQPDYGLVHKSESYHQSGLDNSNFYNSTPLKFGEILPPLNFQLSRLNLIYSKYNWCDHCDGAVTRDTSCPMQWKYKEHGSYLVKLIFPFPKNFPSTSLSAFRISSFL